MGESLYENGVRVKSIRGVPVSTPNISSLSTTVVSVYNSIISLIAHSSLVVYDLYSSTEYGVIQANDHWYGMKGSEEEKHVIEADFMTHEMRFCENDHWIKCTATIGIIDLDIGGRRWEGSVVDGNPHGYGIVYDEEGRKEYEGYQVNGARRALESSITVI